MSEIKKIYENTGVEQDKGNCITCFLDIQTCVRSYDECPYHYPPFTAEKQLELIKWLGKLDMIEIMKTVGEDKVWIISSRYDISEGIYHYVSRNKSFEEALVRLINNLWQDLTEEERKQIRDILKG